MFTLLLSQGKAPQDLSGRTFVFSCLLTTTKDPEKFVSQTSVLHVYQCELIARSSLILPLTASRARRAGWWLSRWNEVWVVPPLAKHGFGYVGSEKCSVETEELVYAPFPDPRRSREGSITFWLPQTRSAAGLVFLWPNPCKINPKRTPLPAALLAPSAPRRPTKGSRIRPRKSEPSLLLSGRVTNDNE